MINQRERQVPRTQEEIDNDVIPRKLSDDYECQQFWAEVLHYYLEGEQWWPDEELESYMDIVTKSHDRVDPTIEALEAKFDLEKNDDWRKENSIKGEEGYDTIGEKVKFATLNIRDICSEIGVRTDDARVSNMISNYVRTKGFALKAYKVDGRAKKGIRVALNRGEVLNSQFAMPIKTSEG